MDFSDGLQWQDLLGEPLRAATIIVVAFIINLIARAFIKRSARTMAKGSARGSRDQSPATSDAITRARREQRATTVGSMLGSLATTVIFAVAIMMVLSELGFNLAPVLASAGVLGLAIGFGAQSLIKDYLAGFFIVVDDQYGIGDIVDVGEAVGTVEDMALRTTRIRSLDGALWHVRNGEILRVANHSQGWARAIIDLRVPYAADEGAVQEVIADASRALSEEADVAEDLLGEPEVWGVEELDGDGLTIRTVVATRPAAQWAVTRAFRAELKRQLDRKGLSVPLHSQVVVHSGRASEGAEQN
ncbi:mechanosensitive ion channel family protein [Nesterenkonia halobia]|uniref:Mechanosensitive ion channel family protein n=1 Tax=Nesterenkonia halobia TaxID=37922 RepID=A0ABP6RH39_9MICC